MPTTKRVRTRHRSRKAVAGPAGAVMPLIQPNQLDGFVCEPAAGNGEKLVAVRCRGTGVTAIGVGAALALNYDPMNKSALYGGPSCRLSDVALRSVIKQLQALLKVGE